MKQLLVLLLLVSVPLTAVSGPTVKSSKSNSSDRIEAPTAGITAATSTTSGAEAGGTMAKPGEVSKANAERTTAAPFGANSPHIPATASKNSTHHVQAAPFGANQPQASAGKPLQTGPGSGSAPGTADELHAGKPTKDQRTGLNAPDPSAVRGKPSKDQKTGLFPIN